MQVYYRLNGALAQGRCAAPRNVVQQRPRAPPPGALNMPGMPKVDMSSVVGMDSAPEVDLSNLRSVKVRDARSSACGGGEIRAPSGRLEVVRTAARCASSAPESGQQHPCRSPQRRRRRETPWLGGCGAPAPLAPYPPAAPRAWRRAPARAPTRRAHAPRAPPPQASSYVSRRRLDDADFDPEAVDEEGLPLVYNEERIAAFWSGRPGELAGRCACRERTHAACRSGACIHARGSTARGV